MSEHRHLLRSASTISTLTILSRVFGYIRDSRIAFLLGTGDSADAFTLAFRIPNLLRRLVGEGAVNAAVVPVLTAYLSDDRKKEAWELVNTLMTILTVAMSVVAVLGVVFSPFLTRLFGTGFEMTPGKLELTSTLNRIMFPYIALVSVTALSMGVLNTLHRFAVPAFAPVLLNLSIIGFSFIAGAFSNPAIALAAGVVAGGVLQVAIQIPALKRSGWTMRPLWDLANPGVRRVANLIVPLLFGIGILQINVFVGLQFASYMPEGSVASLYLADRVMELVLGGYTLALSTAILPLLSSQAAARRTGDMRKTLNLATRLMLFITIPATIGLVVLRREIVEVLFQHGTFEAGSTELTSHALLYFALGLTVISMVKIIVPAFYALQDTSTPVKVAFVSMFLNVGFNFLFMRPLQNGGPALSTSLAAVFDATCLMTLFYRRYGSIGISDVALSLVKFMIAGIAMGIVTTMVIHVPGLYGGRLLQKVFALTLTILVATGTYFASSFVLRVREVGEVWGIYGGQSAVD
jgi:putative peptidoglycan lipid II flippase